ncbi:Protein of unknown function [Micromonospora rhizosphaerae]|uniref:DUF3152 domain-containing protein n=1 Tax=Micromonospora rhizosphaerae TaxID=568872 RepID=A0A1C6R9N3_9ACTN|nr:DUF3152 domain-containing protein [Micromonospora rhizosphaerae]SCL13679.1 Protein of unknown function [Micromonospora rhizosphaerae]
MPASPRPRAGSARPTPAVPSTGRSGTRRWRGLIVVLAFLVAAGGAVAAAVQRPSAGVEVLVGERSASHPAATPSETAPAATLTPSPTPTVAPTPVPTRPQPVLALPGPVPSAGRGSFAYDNRQGEVLGRAGVLRRFRVAVENGSGEDVYAFGDAVQRALAGPGSWVDSGRLRLQRVAPGSGFDFTIYLATTITAGRLCLRGGIDIRVGGRPYTSCRVSGKVVINLDRWRTSVPHLVREGLPLDTYRLYVINHEIGHQLGYRHERCPGVGRPAPVMQQQTLRLDGCVANPWPYVEGRRYTGPPV